MAPVPPLNDLDRTIPIPVRGGGPSVVDSVVSPTLLRLYLLLGAAGMLVGGVLIAAEHPRQPLALPLALAYAVVALSGIGLVWAPASWRQRWAPAALWLLMALAILTAAVGAQVRGYGLAAPSVLVVPVLVFAVTALLGAWPGGALALFAAGVLGLAHALSPAIASPVPGVSQAVGLAAALGVAVVAGGALHARILRAVAAAARREERFTRLLGLAADAYWEVDEQMRVVAADRQDIEMRSLAAAAALGTPIDQLPDLLVEPDVRAQVGADVAARRPFRDLPIRWRHSDGGLRSYLLSGEPKFDRAGQWRGYWGVARDVTAVEATRAALAESQARYEQLFHHAPLPLVLHEAGRIIDANPAAARLLKRPSAESLRGEDLMAQFADGEDRERSRTRMRELESLPAGTPLPQTEFRMNVGDAVVLVRATGVRLLWHDRWVVLTMCVDVTERHLAEQALQRSEATLSHLVDTSPDLITLTDLETARYMMVNRAFERFSGWPQAEAIGRTSLELGVWADPDLRDRFIQVLRRDGSVADMAVNFRRRDGRVVALMISAAQFRLEGRELLVINGRDISAAERDRMERAAILDNASIGIAVTRDRQFVIANAEFERMIGWGGGHLIGQPGSVVWKSEADYAEVGRLVGPVLAQGRAFEFEREVRRRDGSTFLARMRTGVVDPKRPSEGGTVWIVEDVTERRQFEADLARARDEAEAASRAKSAFLANTSHELRTPLNGLLGLARLARDPGLGEPLRGQYLQQIEDSARSLAAIISDILDLSKIEAGRLPIESAPFDLGELLQSLARTYRTLAEARGLALHLDIDPWLGPVVRGDALRVRQIVTNYVTNAIKFTERGHVRLSVRRLPQDAAWVRLACEDTGLGIAADVVPELFKPFTQADQSTTRRFGGTGLGLSICRELAGLMGGRVGVFSEEGRGSCFWTELPLPGSVMPGPAPPAADDGTPRLAGMHVLMVEDNAVNMLIAVAMLERWGARVTQARDGHEALAAVDDAATPFDAVLMDVQMPGISGYEATRALRLKPAGRDVPIIALTAAALVGEREQALAAGMDDFLTKPIDADRLVAALLRWRDGRLPAAEASA